MDRDIGPAFAQVLKNCREQHKLSQEALASLARLDRTFISLLERSERKPSLQTLFDIACALEINAEEMILQMNQHFVNKRSKKR